MRFNAGKVAAIIASFGCTLLSGAAALTAATPIEIPALPEQPVPAPRLWSDDALSTLYAEVKAAEGEGLDISHYDLAGLVMLSAAGKHAVADEAANTLALALATDYARGRVNDPSRLGWHIDGNPVSRDRFAGELRAALRDKRLQEWLRGLLPDDPRYSALRAAYASTPIHDQATRAKLAANMERWRWMPRSLGKDHIYVNVPSYTLSLVDEGKQVSSYTVVVGKPSTPTPQIAVAAQSVVVNPWWNVPRSIARTLKAGAGQGYVFSGSSVRQRPGPGNALGKIKIDMPNPHSIYLHDTPSKALFAEKSRAYSHGCIRVKDIDRLAVELMELDRGDAAQVERALAGSATRTVRLPQTRPVYLVYFTMDIGSDGRLVTLEDPYGRDAKLIASMERETQLAASRLKVRNRATA